MPQDIARAARLAAQAADAGNPQVQLAAADLYARCSLPRDPAKSARWLTQAASQGNAAAIAHLAIATALGAGVAKDYAQAVRLLRQPARAPFAADRESAMVADAYLEGMGSVESCSAPLSASAVLDAILPDARRGDANAQYLAARISIGLLPMPPDYTEAIHWFTLAANQGDPNSAFALGELYRDGTGVKRDRVKAADWFRKAADKHDPPAAFELANLYNTGLRADLDPPDYAQAVRWYRAAADQGYAPAQTALGVHYESGYGVPRDSTQAAQWYGKAVAQNDPEAAGYLGKLQSGDSARLFLQALELGNDGAGCDLAWLYLQALASPPDGIDRYVEAYKWYDIVFNRCRTRDRCPSGAAESGMNAAARHLNPAQIEEARKLAVAWLDSHGDN